MRLKCKKWLLIPLCAIFLMSHNASALDISQSVTFVKGYSYPYWSDSNGRSYGQGRYDYGTNLSYNSSNAQYFRTDTNSALSASAGQYVSLTAVIIISVTSQSQAVSIQANPRQYFGMVGSSSSVDCPLIDLTETAFQQSQDQSQTWMLRYNISSVCRLKSNVSNNVAMNFSLNGGSTSGVDYLRFVPVFIGVWKAETGFDDTDIINSINRLNTTISGIADKFDDLKDVIEQGQSQEQEATDNIENQTPEDISEDGNTENAQTQSLIASLGGFLSALQGLSATNCNVTLQFPNFAGGSMVVNVCQNKEYTGNIVSVAGSILLVLFYLPLAFVMVNMIYREIRSFTNG